MYLPDSASGSAGIVATTLRSALVVLGLVVGGCASLGPPLEAPKVGVVSVRLDAVQNALAFLGVTLEIANPNPRPLDVEALDAAIAIEGEIVATASLVAPLHIPENGAANADLAAQTGVDALMRAAVAAMRRGVTAAPGRPPTLRYSIEGRVVFKGGLTVPFLKNGELGTPPRSP